VTTIRIAGELEPVRVRDEILSNAREQVRRGVHRAAVDDHRDAMTACGFSPCEHVAKRGIFRIEHAAREEHGIFERDRQSLRNASIACRHLCEASSPRAAFVNQLQRGTAIVVDRRRTLSKLFERCAAPEARAEIERLLAAPFDADRLLASFTAIDRRAESRGRRRQG